jgi:hypothetical protein
MRHGLGEWFDDCPEFAQATAQSRHYILMTRPAIECGKRGLVLQGEVLELAGERAALRGRTVDEEIAHEVAREPDVLAQSGESFVLFDEMAVDFQVLAGDVELNAVGFEGGKDEYCDHRAESGTQARTFAPTKGHPFFMLSPGWKR